MTFIMSQLNDQNKKVQKWIMSLHNYKYKYI